MRSSLRIHPSSSAVPPFEDDDLLSEIFLRLPPQPSSLSRASAVCRRWRLLASDPGFSRCFRRHHCRNPPLLGFFNTSLYDLSFVPTLEAPNRVSPGRLSLLRQRDCHESFSTHGCRHGLVLVSHSKYGSLSDSLVRLMWDPITGEQHRLGSPPGFDNVSSGAVLRAAGDGDHFQVVLVDTDAKQRSALVGTDVDQRAIASVYSSATGEWSNPVSTPFPFPVIPNEGGFRIRSLGALSHIPAVLIGSSLYWFLSEGAVGILEFDLDRHNLATIGLPAHLHAGCGSDYRYSIMRADDGGLGFLYLSGLSAQLWKRKTDHNGAASSFMDAGKNH